MRIDWVKLRNFRSHQNTTVDLERISFVRGLNKTGKSAIVMGVEMALAGRCSATDEAGKGYEELISEGAQAGTVTVHCAHPECTITLVLDRTAGRTLKIETGGNIITGQNAREWITRNIAPPDVINACLNAWRFMMLDEAEQAELLARVLLPAKLTLAPAISTWLKANALGVVEKPTLFQTIEATHKAIATARTDVNRRLRDLKAIAEPDPILGNSDNLKSEIRALQEEQAQLNGELLRVSNAQAVRDSSGHHAATLQTAIDAQQTKIDELLAKLLPAERITALRATVKKGARYATVKRELGDHRIALARATAEKQKLAESGADAACPTCKRPLDDQARLHVFEPLLQAENTENAAVQRLEKELATMPGDPDEATRLLKEHTANEEAIDAGNAEIRRLQNTLAEVSTNEHADTGEAVEQIKAKLAELKPKLVRDLERLTEIVSGEERHRQYAKQLAERKRTEERLGELQKLLDYFGPGGIKAELIAERLETFTARLNRVMSAWGYDVNFVIEPYSLRVNEAFCNAWLSPRQLSNSEKYRLGIAFAAAIAEWTGFGLLVADGADILDKPDKWHLAELLVDSDLDQAVITSTGIAGTFYAPDSVFYTLTKTAGATTIECDPIPENTTALA